MLYAQGVANLHDDRRNTQLDGLRGIAAVNVTIFHTILEMDQSLIPRIVYGKLSDLNGPYDWFSKTVLKIFSGETAVFIFFVMSGTVLFQSLMRSGAPFLAIATKFSIRRAFRIYPALIGCLLVHAFIFMVAGRPVSVEALMINATLFDFPVNGVTWTLNVEMVGVAFVLLAYLGWRLARLPGLLIATLAIWLLFKIPNLPVATLFKGFWVYFVIGMLIPTNAGAAIAKRLPPLAIWPILLIAIAFKSTLQQVAIGLLITMIFYDRAGAFGRFLDAPIFQFFGRISYSFYLYNCMVFILIAGWVRASGFVGEHPIEVGLLTSVAIVAVTIPFAYFSTRFVESPGIAAGRMLTNGRVMAPAE